MKNRHPDVRAVFKALPPQAVSRNAHAALERLNYRAQRFDAALLILRSEPLPAECRELAERIAFELERR